MPSLSAIGAQFLATVPLRNFTWTDSDQSMQFLQSQDTQLEILQMTVKSVICKKYPPSMKYRQSFLKSLIQKCESNGYEIVDALYETYTTLLSQSQAEGHEGCYRTYLLSGESCVVILKESDKLISEGTTGLNTWPAASYMAEWSMENTDVFSGRVVLELGSGMGLTGLTICKMCHPGRYIFSDCHPSVLRDLKDNVAINLPGSDSNESTASFSSEGQEQVESDSNIQTPSIEIECIDWEEIDEGDVLRWNAGVILAADVVYDTRIIEPLVRLLGLLLKCQGDRQGRPVAYIASTIRNEETYHAFLQALEKHHVPYTKVPGSKFHTLYYDRSCSIQLLRLCAEKT